MAPRAISSDVFKNRKEIPKEVIEQLLADGGIEKVKTLMVEKWGYSAEQLVALPCLTVNTEGRISGAKWHVIGVLGREVNLKLSQLNPEADEDTFICIKNIDLSIFSFYNKRRNVSGWIDSTELDYSIFRKARSKKQPVVEEQYEAVGFKGFSIRVGVLPVSVKTATLIVALHPMSKEMLKTKAPDCYFKNSCPQVALPIGENNARQLVIKLGLEESTPAETGCGIFPVIEDLRKGDVARPSSWEIRVALHNFLRSCKGFNNKSAKKTLEAMDDIAAEASKNFEPECIWPEHVAAEGDEPIDELGKWQNIVQSILYRHFSEVHTCS